MCFTMQKHFFRTLQFVFLGFPVPLKFAHVSSILLLLLLLLLLFFLSFQQPGETTHVKGFLKPNLQPPTVL